MSEKTFLKIYRQPASHERNNPMVQSFNVVVDNKKVDSIRPDEKKLIDITPGHHTVVVKQWLGAGTEKMEINLPQGTQLSLECGWLSSPDVKGNKKFVISGLALASIAVIACVSWMLSKSGLTVGIVGVLLVVCLLDAVFGLIGVFKPGWLMYLKESE